ncbi:hypothetical protein BT93_B2555 [Corymbia citriodora subsp. variegata]|nr:hypothetical protein BT93_B2555 [Corymbia citriodora subsp. variegata]
MLQVFLNMFRPGTEEEQMLACFRNSLSAVVPCHHSPLCCPSSNEPLPHRASFWHPQAGRKTSRCLPSPKGHRPVAFLFGPITGAGDSFGGFQSLIRQSHHPLVRSDPSPTSALLREHLQGLDAHQSKLD